jgi:hypothetical protein
MSKSHALFSEYPLNGSVTISTGVVPTPYHIYDGFGAFIGGSIDLAAVRHLLRDQSIQPVEASYGRSLMGIWICNFTDASLGPHHELQFSFFTSDGTDRLVSPHPLGLLEFMTRPSVRMLCHGLWNNTKEVVAYNRELLSLNSRMSTSDIQLTGNTLKFNFNDASGGLLSGALPEATRPSFLATWDLTRQIGLSRMWKLARQPWMGLRILNPTGVVLDRNAVADSFTKNSVNVVRYFQSTTDSLHLAHPVYASLDFQPQFIQFMKGFKFVYLQPE